MIELIFFLSIFLVIYSYSVYPLLMLILSRIYRNEVSMKESTPSVTLIISAYNEEDVIADKIENSLMLEYPAEKLQIMVVSDCSSDKTDEIVRGYSQNNIVLLSSQTRRGKTYGLNEAVLKAKGEVLVFSDADSMYPEDVLGKMVRLLTDPSVGLVTGTTKYMDDGSGQMVETGSIYTRLEKMIKGYESKIGSCVGADGAIFAMRKSLFRPLRDDDINDFVIPLNVIKQGYRVIVGEEVHCSEASSSDSTKEFHRQVRITNRTLRALFRHTDLMNVFKYPLFSFELISHKLIRLSAPFFLLILIPLNLILAGEGLVYNLILSAQLVFYCLALIGLYEEYTGRSKSKLSFVYHFVMVQVAIFIGWCEYLSGKNQVTWNA